MCCRVSFDTSCDARALLDRKADFSQSRISSQPKDDCKCNQDSWIFMKQTDVWKHSLLHMVHRKTVMGLRDCCSGHVPSCDDVIPCSRRSTKNVSSQSLTCYIPSAGMPRKTYLYGTEHVVNCCADFILARKTNYRTVLYAYSNSHSTVQTMSKQEPSEYSCRQSCTSTIISSQLPNGQLASHLFIVDVVPR